MLFTDAKVMIFYFICVSICSNIFLAFNPPA